jgi:hypothetical protein
MENKKIQIIHQQFSITQEGRTQELNNYMVIVETIDGIPQTPYLVDMYDYFFWDNSMLYYIVNKN